ncbi:hypothetical protein M440DRAFT_1446253 [Trichoderma longibrachiatum ATCC 18648]|uniref:Aminoglycoside phosphotransferase domain-containing protein n=1 Tax=Trichoderma longibrachiatum ATCC 18648 TaxID=983965 RepID=A0A2T4BWX2_TRILO|nr:hypothetical protein M440DRAFT_1446253 [Trichoderma longibrachiatum ATCC 18648]
MPKITYTLDSAIENFFSEEGTSVSRAECDAFVRQRYGAAASPVAVQGLSSYTVIAGIGGDKIIQFRQRDSPLDESMLKIAKAVHGDLVPSCSHLGWNGDLNGSRLSIYEMNRLPGENYITTRSELSFSADAWRWFKTKGHEGADMVTIKAECEARFEHLAKAIPSRFMQTITEIQIALPPLFDGSYPMVLTHGDLNEMNILVNPHTGEITGIVDWAEASIQPFGFALYALENCLGSMGPDGWKWFEDADSLRNAFWQRFTEVAGLSETQRKLAELAGKAGILLRYGTAYDAGFSGVLGVRDPMVDDFSYLDALLL